MQATVVKVNSGGNNTVFDTIVTGMSHGTASQSAIDYVSRGINKFQDFVTNSGHAIGKTAMNTFNVFTDNFIVDQIKDFSFNRDSVFNDNFITELTVDNISEANSMMRRVMMVQANIYELNKINRCTAFNDNYMDIDPEVKVLEDKYDYRRIHSGIIDENSDDGITIHYHQETLPWDTELTANQQVDILNTFNTMDNLLSEDIDPTNPELDEL